MNPPKYSLIVPTYNRVNELRELFPSINGLQKSNLLELIIVDDGSTDSTEEYVKNYKSKLEIKYYKQKNLGPGSARNLGMKKAHGEYFLFVDSDCILPSDYLIKIDEFLINHDSEAFGGPDTYHHSFSPLLKAINYSMTSFIGTGGTRGGKNGVTKFYPRSFNMGLHRSVFDRIGGFSSLRHGQDMDYSARIYEAGFKVDLIADAYVYHKRRTSLWKFFKQIHNWGVTRINLASLHDGMLKPIHLAPSLIVLVSITGLIALPFLNYGWIIFVLGSSLVVLLGMTAFIQSLLMYGSIKIALLSIITLFIQVGAYGIGTLNGIWQKWILKRKIAIGITRNYY